MALAVQFEGIGENAELPIDSLVTVGAPKGAMGAGVGADQIWLWDSTAADWVKYFYHLTGKNWRKAGEPSATTDSIGNGATFFFYRGTGGAATTLTLSGAVREFAAQPTHANLIAGEYRFMAYPWPSAMKIADFKNYQGAPKGAMGAGVGADQIWRWDTENNDWVKYFYHLTGKNWRKVGESVETSDSIPIGEGFFFYRGTGGATDTVTFTYSAE